MSSITVASLTIFQQIKELLDQSEKMAPIYKARKLAYYWEVGQLLLTQQIKEQQLMDLANWLAQQQQPAPTLPFLKAVALFYQYYPSQGHIYFELSWTHYQQLVKVPSKAARDFYTFYAVKESWTVKQLRRQIATHYFDRLRQPSAAKEDTSKDAAQQELTIIKQNYLLEFLPIDTQDTYTEKELEDALINDLQYFLLELGSGFAFVSRQQRIVLPTGKCFYIDLVFYNYLLRRFVLIDLKTGTLNHQDIGQMDMYTRLADEKWKAYADHPTIGLLLCNQVEETLLKYTSLSDNPRLFAAEYSLELLSQETMAIRQMDKEWIKALINY